MQVLRKSFGFICLILFFAAVSIFTTKAIAQTNYANGNTVSLSKGQTINEDYFAAGGNVIIDGNINGDTYVAGGNVVINGMVNGDVLAAGGNISINGKVTGNVRVAGGQVSIAGEVGKNVTAAGGSVSIQYPAKITGSLTCASGNLSLLAPIGKGATIAGKQVSIDTSIGGNITGAVGQLDILPSSTIAGNLTYWSNTQANIPKSTVKGGITYHYANWTQKPVQQSTAKMIAGFSIVWAFVSLATSFVLGLLLLNFFPVFMQDVFTAITSKTWLSLGVGFLTVIFTPIACIVLLITVVGIPIAVILGLSFLIFAFLNKIFISYAIGKKLQPDKNLLALLVGLVINGIIGIIPVIGWIWNFIVLIIGVGAIVMVEKQLYVLLRQKKII